jgi:hypothetical protein
MYAQKLSEPAAYIVSVSRPVPPNEPFCISSSLASISDTGMERYATFIVQLE